MILCLPLELPEELVKLANSKLDSSSGLDRQALYNVYFASSALCRIAQPILFSHFSTSGFIDATKSVALATRMAALWRAGRAWPKRPSLFASMAMKKKI